MDVIQQQFTDEKKIKNNEITQTKPNVSEFDSILATFSRHTFVRNYLKEIIHVYILLFENIMILCK